VISFADVLEAWMACSWILSIEYPARLHNTCLSVEQLLKNGGRMPSVVRKWLNAV